MSAPAVAAWERVPAGLLLTAIYLLGLAFLAFKSRDQLADLRQSWWQTALLALLGLFSSTLLPLAFTAGENLLPLNSALSYESIITLFAFIPLLLAAALLNLPAALLVGLATGTGRMFWISHSLVDPFFLALTGAVLGWALRQRYDHVAYGLLRRPIVSAPLLALFAYPLLALNFFVYAPAASSWPAALDFALAAANRAFWIFGLELLLAALIVHLVWWTIPRTRYEPEPLLPAPHEHSLSTRLVTNFVLFSFLLAIVLTITVSWTTVREATRLVTLQMAHDTNAVLADVPAFSVTRQQMLRELASNEDLLSDDPELRAKALRDAYRLGDFYRQLMLVDAATGEVLAAEPAFTTADELTNAELDAVELAAIDQQSSLTPGQSIRGKAERATLSFVTGVPSADESVELALIGRVTELNINGLVTGLDGTMGAGYGFITDELGQIVAHSGNDNILNSWQPAEGAPLPDADLPGAVYEGVNSRDNSREIVYYVTDEATGWHVVTVVPYDVVLALAFDMGWKIFSVVGLLVLGFSVYLTYYGRALSRPLDDLVAASQVLAKGDFSRSIEVAGEDEVAQLGHAFERMRRSMQGRFDEQKLLLNISQGLSNSIDLNRSLPSILKGAIRGTGAAGACMVVVRSGDPIRFAEGHDAEELVKFDRRIFRLVNSKQSAIVLSTATEVREALGLSDSQPAPAPSLVAVPLIYQERVQGALWLGYRERHRPDSSELRLLSMLASQAVVLIENNYLYANADNQRRRIAAVLANIGDPVIETDRTNRVTMVNPAFEDAFGISQKDAFGRPVGEILPIPELTEALTLSSDNISNAEVTLADGRTFHANVRINRAADNAYLGRVAILVNVTQYKKLDELKSEFVRTVSHDLGSPLASIRGFATMLPIAGGLNDKQKNYVTKIVNGVDRMTAMVANLLDLNRFEAGTDLANEPIRFERLISGLVTDLRDDAREAGIRLLADVEAGLPITYGDREWLRHALSNLIANAFKYAPNSGDLTISARHAEGRILLAVSDKGPGIAAKHIP
ncbi:MAG: HAMP domain-containing protein, partial [Anaerolineales bacterium]|nr:HAMP domain-containing protein [Anaerolineales bacterium]